MATKKAITKKDTPEIIEEGTDERYVSIHYVLMEKNIRPFIPQNIRIEKFGKNQILKKYILKYLVP